MALRLLHRSLLAKPLFSLRTFGSQAQVDPAVEKSTDTEVKPKPTKKQFHEVEQEIIPPVIEESNPVNHNESHIGYFYRLSNDTFNRLFYLGGVGRQFLKQRYTFNEACLMVRKPALEIINNLRNTDFSKPAVRQVIYGKHGCGKTLTLAHVVHYGANSDQNFLLVHVPWINKFVRHAWTVQPSIFVEGALDVPHDGSRWLENFKRGNIDMLSSNRDLKTSKHYQWNDHEATEEGVPLIDLVDFGIKRQLYSNQVIDSLLKEIKANTINGVCKTLVAVDGFNGFLQECVITHKRVVHKGRLSLSKAFLDITKFDWCNAAVVVTVDQIAHPRDGPVLHKPYELLGKEGWEHLDPFVPIEVGNYTHLEAQNTLEYYIQKKWLINPAVNTPEGRDELIYLSGYNPRELRRLCNPL